MNVKKAEEIADNWLSAKPKNLDPKEVFDVLESLGFIFKRKVNQDTTFIYEHPYLKSEYFPFGALRISIHHGKGQKDTILIGSVRPILEALKIFKKKKVEKENGPG